MLVRELNGWFLVTVSLKTADFVNLSLCLCNLVWHHPTKSCFLLFVLQACFSWTGHQTEPAKTKTKLKLKSRLRLTRTGSICWLGDTHPFGAAGGTDCCPAFLLVQVGGWRVLKSSKLRLGERGTVLGQEGIIILQLSPCSLSYLRGEGKEEVCWPITTGKRWDL